MIEGKIKIHAIIGITASSQPDQERSKRHPRPRSIKRKSSHARLEVGALEISGISEQLAPAAAPAPNRLSERRGPLRVPSFGWLTHIVAGL